MKTHHKVSEMWYGETSVAHTSSEFLWLNTVVGEFVPLCSFLWRLRQALHALINLIKWTFSPLAALMHKTAASRQTLSYLTRSTRALLISISQSDPRSKFPSEQSQPTSPTIPLDAREATSVWVNIMICICRVFSLIGDPMNHSSYCSLSVTGRLSSSLWQPCPFRFNLMSFSTEIKDAYVVHRKL